VEQDDVTDWGFRGMVRLDQNLSIGIGLDQTALVRE